MIALDTNVLLRVLVDDPGEKRQCEQARAAVKAAGRVYIPQIVQAELVWVLESAYEMSRKEISPLLRQLADNSAYELQSPQSYMGALTHYEAGGADFSDYLILAESGARKMPLLSFDRKLQKTPGAVAP